MVVRIAWGDTHTFTDLIRLMPYLVIVYEKATYITPVGCMGYATASEWAAARQILGKNGFKVALLTLRGLRQVQIARRLKITQPAVSQHLRAAIGKCPRIARHLSRSYSLN